DRLAGSPSHSAKGEDLEKRVIKRPGVMARNAAKNAALASLKRPDQRPCLTVHLSGGQHFDSVRVAEHGPIRLVEQVQLLEAAGDDVVCWRDKVEDDRRVKVSRRAGLGREADPLGQLFRFFICYRRGMEHDHTTAACLVVVELAVSFGTPIVVPKVE